MIIPKFPINIPKLPSLPEIELSPIPELIFLRTVKGALSFVFNLSLLDLSLILIITLLVNANPPIRQKAAVSLSLLLLIFGLEISAINVYALVRRLAIVLRRKSVDGTTDKVVLLAFPFDYSRAAYYRYLKRTQWRDANYNRLHPADAHRRRKTRTLKVAPSSRDDHGRARLSQVRSIGKCRDLYRCLRRVRVELYYIRRRRSGYGYLERCAGAEHGDLQRPPHGR